jgi:hypothetical protein
LPRCVVTMNKAKPKKHLRTALRARPDCRPTPHPTRRHTYRSCPPFPPRLCGT